MEEVKFTPWTLHCEPLEYLDGIQSGLTIMTDNGVPVAYMFDHARATLAAAAPELFEALGRAVADELGDNWRSYARQVLSRARGGE